MISGSWRRCGDCWIWSERLSRRPQAGSALTWRALLRQRQAAWALPTVAARAIALAQPDRSGDAHAMSARDCASAGHHARPSSAWTPAPPSSRRRRPTCTSAYETGRRSLPDRPTQDPDPGRRAQPHRAGHRVRLLLLPGGVCAARDGLRDHHGQLQPGDGLAPTTTPPTGCTSSR